MSKAQNKLHYARLRAEEATRYADYVLASARTEEEHAGSLRYDRAASEAWAGYWRLRAETGGRDRQRSMFGYGPEPEIGYEPRPAPAPEGVTREEMCGHNDPRGDVWGPGHA